MEFRVSRVGCGAVCRSRLRHQGTESGADRRHRCCLLSCRTLTSARPQLVTLHVVLIIEAAALSAIHPVSPLPLHFDLVMSSAATEAAPTSSTPLCSHCEQSSSERYCHDCSKHLCPQCNIKSALSASSTL
jgi:hypothetical protein